MRKLTLLSLVLLGLLLAGCQTAELRWVNTEMGLPNSCSRTLETKNADIEYCLVENGGPGKWYLEGVMSFRKGNHNFGRIAKADIRAHFYKGDEEVYQTTVAHRGNSMDKPLYIYKNIEFDGTFDAVYFSWRFTYKM